MDLKQLAVKLGLTSEEAEKLADGVLSIDDAVAKVQTSTKEMLAQNPDFVGKIRTEGKIEEKTNFNKVLRKAFPTLTQEDIQDKDIAEILNAGLKKTEQEYIKQYQSANDEKLVKELTLANNLIKERDEKIYHLMNEEMPKRLEAVQRQVLEDRKEVRLEHALTKKNLSCDPDIALAGFQKHLVKQGYKIELKDDNILELKTKEGTRPVKKNANGAESWCDLDEVMDEFLVSNKMLAQSNANANRNLNTTPTNSFNYNSTNRVVIDTQNQPPQNQQKTVTNAPGLGAAKEKLSKLRPPNQ